MASLCHPSVSHDTLGVAGSAVRISDIKTCKRNFYIEDFMAFQPAPMVKPTFELVVTHGIIDTSTVKRSQSASQ